ncbi:MAG: hypothetical protein MJD61_08250 [Proteobacteria bacterium]|nr:hypothetical protein [Pseudomonadota bacterium]
MQEHAGRASQPGAATQPSARGRCQGDPLALVGASIVPTHGPPVIAQGNVVIRCGRIESIGKATPVPATARTVDVRGKWIIPGLIDAHIHFFQSGGLYTRPDIVDLRAVTP